MIETYDISVIVPVYGVERYIERSLRSLWEKPTTLRIEYILVNDCTRDRSMEIAQRVRDDYPWLKGNVRTIDHLYNRGSAAARQTGLDAATGKYIMYLDSDDFCEPNMLEKLYAKAEEETADIVLCDFYYDYSRRVVYSTQCPISCDPYSCIVQLLEGSLHGATWNKIVRRKLYRDHGIRYIEGMNMWEDLYACVRLFFYAERIVYLNEAFLHYIQYNTASLTANASRSRRMARETILAAVMIEKFLRQRGVHSPRMERAIDLCKLHAKKTLILSSDRKDNFLWLRVFPESNRCIWQDGYTDWIHRFAFLCARYRCFGFKNFLLGSGRRLKKILNR